MTDVAPIDHCYDVAREADYDRYLLGLLAPSDAVNGWMALLAFNHEVARAREAVSEATLGHIRLQWWREALDGIAAGTPRRHPVVLALAEGHAVGRLDIEAAGRVIEAREADMEDTPFETLDALDAYAAEAGGMFAHLLARACGASSEAVPGIVDVGAAWALVGIVRATPHLARQRRVMLPLRPLGAAGLTVDTVVAGKGGARLVPVVEAVLDRAAERLDAARTARAPRDVRPVLRLGVLAAGYLRRVRRAGGDPFARPVAWSALSRQMALLRAKWLGPAVPRP